MRTVGLTDGPTDMTLIAAFLQFKPKRLKTAKKTVMVKRICAVDTFILTSWILVVILGLYGWMQPTWRRVISSTKRRIVAAGTASGSRINVACEIFFPFGSWEKFLSVWSGGKSVGDMMDERDDEEKMIFLFRDFRLERGRVGVGYSFVRVLPVVADLA